jgi:hypothetical protein
MLIKAKWSIGEVWQSTYLTSPVLLSAKFLVDQFGNITRGNEEG